MSYLANLYKWEYSLSPWQCSNHKHKTVSQHSNRQVLWYVCRHCQTLGASEQDVIVRPQPGCKIIGIQDGYLQVWKDGTGKARRRPPLNDNLHSHHETSHARYQGYPVIGRGLSSKTSLRQMMDPPPPWTYTCTKPMSFSHTCTGGSAQLLPSDRVQGQMCKNTMSLTTPPPTKVQVCL